jgi:hypothetical protein
LIGGAFARFAFCFAFCLIGKENPQDMGMEAFAAISEHANGTTHVGSHVTKEFVKFR